MHEELADYQGHNKGLLCERICDESRAQGQLYLSFQSFAVITNAYFSPPSISLANCSLLFETDTVIIKIEKENMGSNP